MCLVVRLEDFDGDVAALTQQYRGLPVECQNEAMLGDFQRRWQSSRSNLELRLNRRRI